MKRIFTFLIILLFAASSFSQQNQYQWTLTGGGAGAEIAEGVTTDNAGNAYITGAFRSPMTIIDTEILSATTLNTMFLAKVSPEQELVWLVTAEADGNTGASGFKTVYKNGFVYVMGDFRGNATFYSADFSEINLTSTTRAMFIAKYTDSGMLEWVRKMESSNTIGIIPTGSANNMVVDDAGAVYFTTHFRTDIDLSGTVVTPELGGTSYFFIVAKYDALGAYQWHWNSTNAGDDRGEAITLTPGGNILFSVRYASSLTVNEITTENAFGGMALIELDSDGEYVWDHHFLTAATNQSAITGLESDADNNIYIGGQSRTTLTWDEETVYAPINATRLSAMLIKLNANREIVWANFFGNPDQNDNISAVKLSAEGKVYVAGIVRGLVEFNDDLSIETNGDNVDAFWAAFTPEGVAIEAGTFGGTSNEVLSDLAISPNNDIYLFGRFQNEFQAGEDTFTSAGSWDFYLVKMGDLSSNALLAEIHIDEEPLADFDPEVFVYEVALAAGTEEVPLVAAIAAHPAAEVTVVQALNLDGTEVERTAVITVIAEDPEFTSEYTVTFRLKSVDASLASITIEEEVLEGFDAETFEYLVSLPFNTPQVPEVEAIATDENAQVSIIQAQNLTGTVEERTTVITVVAEDPGFTSEYTVTFRLKSDDATLADILLDGVSLESFSPIEVQYFFSLNHDEEIPVVTAIASDENATVVIGDPEDITGDEYTTLVVITVTAEDNTFWLEYWLWFRYKDTDASLTEITLDEVALEGFDPEVFAYQVTLPAGSTEVPEVDAVATSESATVVITQATDLLGDEAARTATIVVTAEDGAFSLTYTIVFDRDVTSVDNPQIQQIKVFPNPVVNQMNITGLGTNVKGLSLIDITGQTIWSTQVIRETEKVDLTNIPGGIYMLRVIKTNGSIQVIRIIKR
jgi:hypothetical protein